MRKEGVDRRFLLASARAAESAARTAAEALEPIDLVVTSPTALARQAVPVAVGGRRVFTAATLVGRFSSRTGVVEGDAVEVSVDQRALHFFDPQTGIAIRGA
jgi:hypothetical protein